MRRFRVYYETTASATVTVEVDESDLDLSDEELKEMSPDGLTELFKEKAVEMGYELTPQLSAQQSGWGQDWSMEIGDWEALEDEDPVETSVDGDSNA